jgi:rubrerythrin
VAKAFYRELFDWKLTDISGMDYTMIGVGEGTGGGLMKNLVPGNRQERVGYCRQSACNGWLLQPRGPHFAWVYHMDHLIQEALRTVIVTGRNSMDFYRCAAARVSAGSARSLFERLAIEEARRLEFFLSNYTVSDYASYLDHAINPSRLTSPPHREMQRTVTSDFSDMDALKLALKEKALCLNRYLVLAEAFKEPELHFLFQMVVDENRRHQKALRKEYQQINLSGNRPVLGCIP